MNFEKKYGIELPSLEDVDSQENPDVVAHFTRNDWEWFIVGGDPLGKDNVYMLALVDGDFLELGMVLSSELETIGAEFDKDWSPVGLYDVHPDFKR